MLDNTAVGVDEIQDCVSIVLLTSCENTDLKHSAQIGQRLLQILPQFHIQSRAWRLVWPIRYQYVELKYAIFIGLQACLEGILGALYLAEL